MLETVGNQLESRKSAGWQFVFLGKVRDANQLLADIDEALDEWRRLDALLIAVAQQRRRIDSRISVFVDFFSDVRRQIRHFEHKKRRPLTVEQKVVAAAKLRETRRLRHTMGKRQKAKIRS